ncbi:MAG: class I SAM-dependent methyltransferase [Chloroflexi bacterium]|nr:class I SAM-dependent methyltransferase [Chloroflexota bacterium]
MQKTRFAWRSRSSWADQSTQMDTSPYDDWADIYDAVYSYVVEDIPFYVEEAVRSGGPVLELGCGTGRIAIPIAQSGIDIVAVDSSSAMLEHARSKAESAHTPSLNLLQADMRDFEIDTQFALIIIPFRGFLSLLSVEDEMRALATIRRHLAPGGRLVFDIFVPDISMMVQEGDIPYYFRDVIDPATGAHMVIWNQASYDAFSQVMSIRTTIEELDDSGRVASKMYRDFALRYITRWEMHHLLRTCGFDVLALHGDFNRNDFDEDSTDMIWVASPTG